MSSSHRIHSGPGEGARRVGRPAYDRSEDLRHAGKVCRLQPRRHGVRLLRDVRLPKPRGHESRLRSDGRRDVRLAAFTRV